MKLIGLKSFSAKKLKTNASVSMTLRHRRSIKAAFLLNPIDFYTR